MDEAKEVLSLYKKQHNKTETLKNKILEIESSLTPTANIKTTPSGSLKESPTEAAAVKLAELKSKYLYKSASAEILRQKICDLIEEIKSPTDKELLFARYMLLLPWREVAKRIDELRPGKEYKIKFVIGYKHNEALKEFQTILNTTPDKRKEEIYDLARN